MLSLWELRYATNVLIVGNLAIKFTFYLAKIIHIIIIFSFLIVGIGNSEYLFLFFFPD